MVTSVVFQTFLAHVALASARPFISSIAADDPFNNSLLILYKKAGAHVHDIVLKNLMSVNVVAVCFGYVQLVRAVHSHKRLDTFHKAFPFVLVLPASTYDPLLY